MQFGAVGCADVDVLVSRMGERGDRWCDTLHFPALAVQVGFSQEEAGPSDEDGEGYRQGNEGATNGRQTLILGDLREE
jgi:hypothetical protein